MTANTFLGKLFFMDRLAKDLFLQFLNEKSIILVSVEKIKSDSREFLLPDSAKQKELLLEDIVNCMNGMYFSADDFVLAIQQVFKRHNLVK